MFKCENGHESFEGGFCDECGSQMVAFASDDVDQNDEPQMAKLVIKPLTENSLSHISHAVTTDLPITEPKPASETDYYSPPVAPSYAQLHELADIVNQQHRNEDTLRKLCETIIADEIITFEEWNQLQELRPTVTEQTWVKYMALYNIKEPEVFSVPHQIATLHWRVEGDLQAECACVLEFKVTSLADNVAVLTMSFSASPNEFTWETTFTNGAYNLQERSWTPRTHGISLVTISGFTETKEEVLRIGTLCGIRLHVSPTSNVDGATTIINTGHLVSGEVGVKKTFGTPAVPGFLANKGQQQTAPQRSEWSSVPIVIKKREPKFVETTTPDPPPVVVTHNEPATKLVDKTTDSVKVTEVIPATGLAPRPYIITCPNGTEVTVFFGDRLVLGRISDSATIDPLEQLGIACYLPNGDDDVESTKAISRKTMVFEHSGNNITARNIGRSALTIDDNPVRSDQEVSFMVGQQSTITMGATPRLQEGLKPAALSGTVVPGRELTIALQDVFTAYDGTRLILNRQPGAMVLTQKAGRETLRNVWMMGAISIADLTGINKREYEQVYIFRHAARVWLHDGKCPGSPVRELSHRALSELFSGFHVTQD